MMSIQKMKLSEYYKTETSLFSECEDIDYFGGHEIFDDAVIVYYLNHECIAKNTSEVRWKFKTAWRMNLHYFKKLFDSMNYEYDAISNYDKKDSHYWLENERKQITDIMPSTINTTTNETGTITNSTTFSGATETDTYNTTYDDTATPRLTEKSIVRPENTSTSQSTSYDGSGHTINANQTANAGHNELYHDKTDVLNIDNPLDIEKKLDGDRVITEETHTRGNIGVTSTQDLIQQERKIADIEFIKIVVERLIQIACIGVF